MHARQCVMCPDVRSAAQLMKHQALDRAQRGTTGGRQKTRRVCPPRVQPPPPPSQPQIQKQQQQCHDRSQRRTTGGLLKTRLPLVCAPNSGCCRCPAALFSHNAMKKIRERTMGGWQNTRLPSRSKWAPKGLPPPTCATCMPRQEGCECAYAAAAGGCCHCRRMAWRWPTVAQDSGRGEALTAAACSCGVASGPSSVAYSTAPLRSNRYSEPSGATAIDSVQAGKGAAVTLSHLGNQM